MNLFKVSKFVRNIAKLRSCEFANFLDKNELNTLPIPLKSGVLSKIVNLLICKVVMLQNNNVAKDSLFVMLRSC